MEKILEKILEKIENPNDMTKILNEYIRNKLAKASHYNDYQELKKLDKLLVALIGIYSKNGENSNDMIKKYIGHSYTKRSKARS